MPRKFKVMNNHHLRYRLLRLCIGSIQETNIMWNMSRYTAKCLHPCPIRPITLQNLYATHSPHACSGGGILRLHHQHAFILMVKSNTQLQILHSHLDTLRRSTFRTRKNTEGRAVSRILLKPSLAQKGTWNRNLQYILKTVSFFMRKSKSHIRFAKWSQQQTCWVFNNQFPQEGL